MPLSLHTLPVEMVYRILDNLSDGALFLSIYNVSQRLNAIVDSYHRYKVKFNLTYFFNENSFHHYKMGFDDLLLFFL